MDLHREFGACRFTGAGHQGRSRQLAEHAKNHHQQHKFPIHSGTRCESLSLGRSGNHLELHARQQLQQQSSSNNFTYCLVCWAPAIGLAEPDSITIDRDYIHGSPTQDVGQGVQANGSNFAVIDSYISDIHESTFDSQAILAFWTPGPIKIVDNYLSATTEDVLFGGAGDYNNPYVPSDIEIRKNHFFKPLTWDVCGVQGTVPPGSLLPNGIACPSSPGNQWVEKNNLEFKSARRVVVTGNVMENTWVSGQTGSSVLFTIRTSQSGNLAVVDDITFQSNILTDVDAGIGTLAYDDDCGAQFGYPQCTNPGESRRIWIDNISYR